MRPRLGGRWRPGDVWACACALGAMLAGAAVSGCGGADAAGTVGTSPPAPRTSAVGARSRARAAEVPLLATLALPAVTWSAESDAAAGVGAGTEVEARALAARLRAAAQARFELIPAPSGAHPLVCDLTPHRDHLYVSFADQPISRDGARVYRYRSGRAASAASGAGTDSDGRAVDSDLASGDVAGGARGDDADWSLVLNWDRGGAPGVTHEQGGQGITRLRVIDGRVYAADADAPRYGGFGLTSAPLEGYLFVSDPDGRFPPLGPEMSPPAGTRIAPWAFHIFDVIAYRGALVATGGSVSALDPPRRGARYPAALFVAPRDRPEALLEPRYRPGDGEPIGVVRTTYLHRFRGRLYIGFQNNGGRIGWDLAVLSGDPMSPDTAPPVRARVTPEGGWLTARFASGDGALYWVAARYRRPRGGHRPGALFRSRDGLRFDRVLLPPDAGVPQDLLVIGETRLVLTTGGLYIAGRDDRYRLLAPAPPGDPFGRGDTFCSAPLTVFDGTVYAGSTRDGALYRLAPITPP